MAQTTYILATRAESVVSNATCSKDYFRLGSCNDEFDFTLLLEQGILSIIPSAIFLLLAPARLYQLRSQSVKTLPDPIELVKTVTTTTYAALQLALLVSWRRDTVLSNQVSLASAAVSFVASAVIILLSYIEHRRSMRPSALLTVYLLLITLFNATQIRTIFLAKQTTTIPSIMTAALAIGAFLLILESQNKRKYLKTPYKKYSKEATSGLISWSLLWWLNGLFRRGFRTLLTWEDMAPLDEVLTAEPLARRLTIAWNKRITPPTKMTLPLVIGNSFRWEFLVVTIPRLTMIGFYYAQPFLISRAIKFLEEPESDSSTNIGYGLIGATFFIYVGIALANVHYQQRLARLETMVRGGMTCLIFDQTITLREGISSDAAALTLMSTDVDNITSKITTINDIYSSFIEITIGIYLLARQVGVMCIVPILIMGGAVGLQSIVANHIGDSVKNSNGATQKRTAFIASALDSMKSIRMTGLSTTVKQSITELRDREVRLNNKFRQWIIWQNLISNIASPWAPVLTFIAYEIRAQVQHTASLGLIQAFTALAIINLLAEPGAIFLSSIPSLATSMGSFKRLQDYLSLDTIVDHRQTPEKSDLAVPTSSIANEDAIELTVMRPKNTHTQSNAAVVITDLSVRYPGAAASAVSGITLSMDPGTLTMILGPVGSGKTTVLKAVLGELAPESGRIYVFSTDLGFCNQQPFLPNQSVQQIICGKRVDGAVDEVWYKTVVHACALTGDIAALVEGDLTIIGSQGVTLSGGQKQRLALARAIYARQPILLLDDILSALDARTEQIIVDRLLGKDGLLRKMGVTVIVVTHSVRHLSIADKLLILDAEGKSAAQGNYENLHSTSPIFASMLATLRQLDVEHEPVEIRPKKEDRPAAVKGPTAEQQEDLTRRTGDIAVYKYYIGSVGAGTLAWVGFSNALNAFGITFPQVWLEWWTTSPSNNLALRISIYIFLAVLATVSHYAYLWFTLIRLMSNGARRLHAALLDTTFGATQSFFAETDTGITLNRFSQDISVTDRQMIEGVIRTSSSIFMCLAGVGLIATGSPYMAAFIPVILFALYLIQNVYLKTSRQLRYLDLEAKSPLYSHFIETLAGLTTIRAFGWQRYEMEQNKMLLDRSQRPFYLLNCVQRWLQLVLDLLVAGVAVALVALAVNLRGVTSGGLLGIALNNILGFNDNLSNLLRGWTFLETSLGAIARIKNFTSSTPSENQALETVMPPPEWPSQGAITFSHVSASYKRLGDDHNYQLQKQQQLALDDVSLAITPGQKIGICGRTGSGKSTLLLALLRLVETTSPASTSTTTNTNTNTITIDNLIISTIPRDELRSRFVAIPQDPFMLTGSVRSNADPTGLCSDEEITEALEKVGLQGAMESRGGLEGRDLAEVPLSRGQQQLFCLARAMLRKRKSKRGSVSGHGMGGGFPGVLLLDEATSSVDAETDRLMQRVIRKEFKDYTILVVAHRLDTILDADKIVVMEAGRVVEFDSPEVLLGRPGSAFKRLYGSKEGVA